MQRQGHGFKVTEDILHLYHELFHIDEWGFLYKVQNRISRALIGIGKKRFSHFSEKVIFGGTLFEKVDVGSHPHSLFLSYIDHQLLQVKRCFMPGVSASQAVQARRRRSGGFHIWEPFSESVCSNDEKNFFRDKPRGISKKY